MSATSSVFDRLTASHARLGGRLDVGRGRAVALWSNATDRVRYENTGHHTVSLYLVGGEESRRVDRGSVRGWPGALTVMPRGATSDWAIGGAFDFVHLYLDDAQLRHFAVATLDRDPSGLALAELTFHADPLMEESMRRLAGVCASGDVFAAEQEIAEVCHRLLTAPIHGGRSAVPIRGGLAPAVARRVIERMRASLDRPPSLEELAAEAGLSPFHFQRMFRLVHGLSPHAHLEALRVAEAKRLMRDGVGLAEVADACGFCHQSHFTRAFRAATGLTPGAWRRVAAIRRRAPDA